MDLFDVARSCLRRWYVLLPLLLLTAWFAHDRYMAAKPLYYANAVVALAPANSQIDIPEQGVAAPRNGLLEVGGASLMANMAVLGMKDPGVVSRVVASGGLPGYNVRMFPVPPTSPELPLIMVEATGPNPAAVTKTIEMVSAEADPTLRNLQGQAGVPDDQMVRAFTASPPGTPLPGMPTRTRATVAVLAAGVAGSILLTVVIDVVLVSRKKKRTRPVEPTTSSDNGSDEPHGSASVAPVRTRHSANTR